MTCEEIDDLLGAYALGALSPDEAQQARAHLASCRRHDAALADLRSVAERLPFVAGEREPPAALRARLLRAFDAEVASSAPASASPIRRPVSWWRRPAFAWAGAAALLLAVLGLAGWNVALQVGGGGTAGTMRAVLQGSEGTGDLVYLEEEQIAVLSLDLPALPPARSYQAWGISSGGPVSLGLVSGSGVTALSADLSQADVVAITEEPAGGSGQPTSDPLLSTRLPDRS